MTRKRFIEENNATCKNWRWSWSFVNHEEQFVIFGAWDVETEGGTQIILKDEWEINPSTGKKHGAFSESLEYIHLVQDAGYLLKTFRMSHGLADPYSPKGTAKIKGFDKELKTATLHRVKNAWLAVQDQQAFSLPDEEPFEDHEHKPILEGFRTLVAVSRIERSAIARSKCIQAHGTSCKVCEFDFYSAYGEIGVGFIHVHHLNPISESKCEAKIDPVNDLVPVCPNCHAMIHRRNPPYKLEEIRMLLDKPEVASQ